MICGTSRKAFLEKDNQQREMSQLGGVPLYPSPLFPSTGTPLLSSSRLLALPITYARTPLMFVPLTLTSFLISRTIGMSSAGLVGISNFICFISSSYLFPHKLLPHVAFLKSVAAAPFFKLLRPEAWASSLIPPFLSR